MCNPTEQPFDDTPISDDQGISDDDTLIRYLRSPYQIRLNSKGEWVISPQAFKQRAVERGTSVDLDCLLKKDGHDSLYRLGKMPETYAVLGVPAAVARIHASGVAWTPKPTFLDKPGAAGEANPYHGEIVAPVSSAASRAMMQKSSRLADVPKNGQPYPNPGPA